MDNYFDFQTLKDSMKGKSFDSFYLKNIIGQRGLTSQMFFFKEKESSYVHSLNVLRQKISYKKVFDSKYKKSNEQLVILKNFKITDISLIKENAGYSIKFIGTMIPNEREIPIPISFKLTNDIDGMHYWSDKNERCRLINYFNKDATFYEFLSISKERTFNKEELFICCDKFGIPIYTNDKVYDVKNKINGLIKYHFVYKEYMFITEENKSYKLNDIIENIIVFERKDKTKKNNHYFSNIISIFHYLIEEDNESIEDLKDLLDFLSENTLKDNIYSYIDKKIISGELVMECVDDFNVKLTYTYTS